MFNSLSDKSSSSQSSNDFDWIEASIKNIAEEIEYAPGQSRPKISIPQQSSSSEDEDKSLKETYGKMEKSSSEVVSQITDETDSNTPKTMERCLFPECNFRTRNGGMKPY